ncbi:MAG: AAA family ATPase [Planctomycetota bacterium]
MPTIEPPNADPGAAARTNDPVPSPLTAFRYTVALLRGRWWVAVGIWLLMGLAGTAFMYRSQPPIYQATGKFHMHATQQRVLFHVESNTVPPMFESDFQRYLDRLREPAFVAAALDDPVMAGFGLEPSPELVEDLTKGLQVNRLPKSYTVYVQSIGTDPLFARALVEAVLRTFEQEVADRDGGRLDQTLAELERLERQSGETVEDIDAQLAAMTQERGVISIEGDLRLAEQRVDRLDAALLELIAAQQTGTPLELDGAGVAATSAPLARLIETRHRLEDEMAIAEQRMGPQHEHVRSLRSELDRISSRIARQAGELSAVAAVEESTATTGANQIKPVQHLRQQLTQARAHRDDLAKLLADHEVLSAELAEAREVYGQANERLKALRVESAGRSRVDVTPPTVSAKPINADKRLQTAGLGLVGGGLFGLMVYVGVLAFVGRLRSSEQAEMHLGKVRLLGILPKVNTKLDQPEATRVASCCIRHIRHQLLPFATSECRSILVTSSAAGSGKTSFVAAMGHAFAQSGKRVLLVDLDLVGLGLTHRVGESYPSLQLGGGGTPTSVVDALLADQFNPALVPQLTENLWLLPATSVAGQDEAVTASRFTALMERVAPHFDVVMVDTGPVPGSVEAAVASTGVDQIVFLIGTGDRGGELVNAASFMSQVCDTPMAYVFNRAAPYDRGLNFISSSMSEVRHNGSGNGTDAFVGTDTRSVHALVGRFGENVAAFQDSPQPRLSR